MEGSRRGGLWLTVRQADLDHSCRPLFWMTNLLSISAQNPSTSSAIISIPAGPHTAISSRVSQPRASTPACPAPLVDRGHATLDYAGDLEK